MREARAKKNAAAKISYCDFRMCFFVSDSDVKILRARRFSLTVFARESDFRVHESCAASCTKTQESGIGKIAAARIVSENHLCYACGKKACVIAGGLV